jgi:hypothetical protein
MPAGCFSSGKKPATAGARAGAVTRTPAFFLCIADFLCIAEIATLKLVNPSVTIRRQLNLLFGRRGVVSCLLG